MVLTDPMLGQWEPLSPWINVSHPHSDLPWVLRNNLDGIIKNPSLATYPHVALSSRVSAMRVLYWNLRDRQLDHKTKLVPKSTSSYDNDLNPWHYAPASKSLGLLRPPKAESATPLADLTQESPLDRYWRLKLRPRISPDMETPRFNLPFWHWRGANSKGYPVVLSPGPDLFPVAKGKQVPVVRLLHHLYCSPLQQNARLHYRGPLTVNRQQNINPKNWEYRNHYRYEPPDMSETGMQSEFDDLVTLLRGGTDPSTLTDIYEASEIASALQFMKDHPED